MKGGSRRSDAGAKMAPPSQLSIRDEETFCTLQRNRLGKNKFLLSRKTLRIFTFSATFPVRFAVVRLSKKSYRILGAAFSVMKYLYVIVPAILAVILSISSKRAAAQPVCSSAYLDNPQNRKLCATLANFFGLPNSLEAYSDEIRPNFGYGLPLSYKGRLPPSDFIENTPGTKRQDVDHVFLRFGRRR